MNIYVKVNQDLRLKNSRITVEKATYSDKKLRMSEKTLYQIMELVKKAIEETIDIDEGYQPKEIVYEHVVYEGR